MAQSQVTVSFGASVSGLVAGVQQAATAIQSLTAPVHQLNQAFSEIGEGVGLTYAIDKITELVNTMAEVGEHAVNMGTALGMSAEQFQQVNEAMGLVGASGDALVRTERMLSRAAEEATAQPLSRQADAFRALGINANQFAETLRNDPIAAMKELADAAVRSGNLAVSGPLGFLLGRGGGADLIRFFSEGAAGIDKLIAKTKELGSPTNESLDNMEKLARQIHEMTTAMENFGLTVGNVVSGPLSRYLNWLTESYSLGTQWLKGLPQAAPKFGPVGGATPEEQELLDRIKQHESLGRYDILHGPGGHPSGTITDWSQFPQWAGFMGPAGISHAAGAYGFQPGTYAEMAAVTGYTSFLPEAQDINALQLLRTKGTAPWPWLGAGGGAAKMEVPDVNVQADAQSKLGKVQMENSAAAKKAADEQIKDIDRETQARLAQLNFEKTAAGDNADLVHQITQQEVATKLEGEQRKQAVINSTSGAVRAALEQERDGTAALINIQNQAMRVDQEYHKQAVQGELELLNARIKGLNAAEAEDLKQVERRRQLNQITTTDAAQQEEAIVRLYEELVAEILSEEQKKAAGIRSIEQRIAAEQVQQAQEATQKIRDLWDKANQERAKTAQDINKTIAQDFSSTFMSLVTGRETFTQAFAQLGEKLGQTLVEKLMEKLLGSALFGTGGLGGLLLGLPFIGPLLKGERGGIVPSAAGGWVIPQFQSGGILSMLHGGEMVLPRDISEGMQGMIRGGGGGGSVINIHAWDTMTGAQQLMRNANTVGQAALRYSSVSPRAVSSGGARFP